MRSLRIQSLSYHHTAESASHHIRYTPVLTITENVSIQSLFSNPTPPILITTSLISFQEVSQLLFCLKEFSICWLRWVFIAALGPPLAAVSRGCSSLRGSGFSLWWLLLLYCTGSRCVGFCSCITSAPGLGCSLAWEIFLARGLTLAILNWQQDS